MKLSIKHRHQRDRNEAFNVTVSVSEHPGQTFYFFILHSIICSIICGSFNEDINKVHYIFVK